METREQQRVQIQRVRAVGPDAVGELNTDELRSAFLVSGLFEPGELHLVQSELDRLIIGGVIPDRSIRLPDLPEVAHGNFLQDREAGIMNIGPRGIVRVDKECHELDRLDCLYVGRSESEVSFEPIGDSVPEFYFVSCPARGRFPTAKISRREAASISLGERSHASLRRIFQYIHPQGVQSCQLVMGFTELEEASVWNTMPAHTHERRSEVYLYTNLVESSFVVHLMGRPDRTKHLIVRDREAVLSPPWSIHTGAGTRNYSFIWAMAGENQDFGDIEPLSISELR